MKSILLTILVCILSVQISNAQWVPVSNGMGKLQNVLSLAYSGNNIFAGTVGSEVYLSMNNGTSWSKTAFPTRKDRGVTVLAAKGNYIFAGSASSHGGVWFSIDNGTSWTQGSFNGAVFSLAVNENYIFLGTLIAGVYLSTNNGQNWSQTSLDNRDVFSLAANGNDLFAGTQYGVYKSPNNGTTWNQTSLNSGSVYSLAVNGNYVFAGTDAGVYISANNGTTWNLSILKNSGPVYSLAVNGNNIFAGTSVSNNNGANWTQRNEGLENYLVYALCILNNYIFAGANACVFRRPLSELITGVQPISSEIPVGFSLSQNYPNPFNPTTKIRFAFPKSSFAKLVIYDALGREMETVVNEQLDAGTYEADWNASNYPSGVYYYKLIAGNYIETRKMILVK